jgi:hypothetical protein
MGSVNGENWNSGLAESAEASYGILQRHIRGTGLVEKISGDNEEIRLQLN